MFAIPTETKLSPRTQSLCATHDCRHKHDEGCTLIKFEKEKKTFEEQSITVFGHNLFACSFYFAKKSIFVLKSDPRTCITSKGCSPQMQCIDARFSWAFRDSLWYCWNEKLNFRLTFHPSQVKEKIEKNWSE